MKNLTTIAILLIFGIVLLSGCTVTKASVRETNEKIQAKYSSADSFMYTIDETTNIDGKFVSSQKYTEIIKKPDKTRTVLVSKVEPPPTAYSQFSGIQIVTSVVCNGNTSYNTITPTLTRVWSYVGWPTGEASFCGEQIALERGKWAIPMEINDTRKYEVTISEEMDYGGEEGVRAIKAVVKMLKQPEVSLTYWFLPEDFAILKEEINANGTVCTPPLVNELGEEVGNSSKCKNGRITITRIYSGFGFNISAPDSVFIVNPADFPRVTFENATVNWRGG